MCVRAGFTPLFRGHLSDWLIAAKDASYGLGSFLGRDRLRFRFKAVTFQRLLRLTKNLDGGLECWEAFSDPEITSIA